MKPEIKIPIPTKEEKNLFRSGKGILAIKSFRKRTGLGLYDAVHAFAKVIVGEAK